MVDLVKIRKKKAKARESGVGSGESEQKPAAAATRSDVANARESGVGSRGSEMKPVEGADSSPIPDPRPPTPASPKLDQFKAAAGQRREGFVERDTETTSANQVELLTFLSDDHQEALHAMREKRAPEFRGR